MEYELCVLIEQLKELDREEEKIMADWKPLMLNRSEFEQGVLLRKMNDELSKVKRKRKQLMEKTNS